MVWWDSVELCAAAGGSSVLRGCAVWTLRGEAGAWGSVLQQRDGCQLPHGVSYLLTKIMSLLPRKLENWKGLLLSLKL